MLGGNYLKQNIKHKISAENAVYLEKAPEFRYNIKA